MRGGADEPGSTAHFAPGACFQVKSTSGNGMTHSDCIDAASAGVSCVWLYQLVAAMLPLTYAQLEPGLEVGAAAAPGTNGAAPESREIKRTDMIGRASALRPFATSRPLSFDETRSEALDLPRILVNDSRLASM